MLWFETLFCASYWDFCWEPVTLATVNAFGDHFWYLISLLGHWTPLPPAAPSKLQKMPFWKKIKFVYMMKKVSDTVKSWHQFCPSCTSSDSSDCSLVRNFLSLFPDPCTQLL